VAIPAVPHPRVQMMMAAQTLARMSLSLEAGPAAEGQAVSAAPGFGSRSSGTSPEALP